jgi:hypothetical protein
MRHHVLATSIAVAVVLVFVSRVSAAEDLEGKVVSAGEGKITIIGKDNEEQVLEVAPNAKITRDKKSAKLSDLQEGDAVTLKTESRKSKPVVVVIVALSEE